MKFTSEELQAVFEECNSRVGQRLEDRQGRSFWITDVSSDGLLRVVSERGVPCWWNEQAQMAVPVGKPKAVVQL